MTTTDGGRELFLTIVNDGKGYDERRRNGYEQFTHAHNMPATVRGCALRWVGLANEGARAYERQFGSPGGSCFTVADILCAAAELADYYENHARELDELMQAEG